MAAKLVRALNVENNASNLERLTEFAEACATFGIGDEALADQATLSLALIRPREASIANLTRSIELVCDEKHSAPGLLRAFQHGPAVAAIVSAAWNVLQSRSDEAAFGEAKERCGELIGAVV